MKVHLLTQLVQLVVVWLARSSSRVVFQSLFESKLFSEHKISSADLSLILDRLHSVSYADIRPHFLCGPASQLKDKRKFLSQEHSVFMKTAFVKRSMNTACLIGQMSGTFADRIVSLQEDNGEWSAFPLPPVLKVHPSLMSFTKRAADQSNEESAVANRQKLVEGASLFIEYAASTDPDVDVRNFTREILQESALGSKDPHRRLASANRITDSQPWTDLVQSIETLFSGEDAGDAAVNVFPTQQQQQQQYALPPSVIIEHHEQSSSFSNLKDVSLLFLVSLVEVAAHHPFVLRISLSSRPQLFNFETRGMLQSGERYVEPFGTSGLTGKGQIIGIADSGVNDLSCFFIDDSNAYPTLTTNRSGVVQPLRRKVIQYSVNADMTDDRGGHGTHVAGTVCGSSTELSSNNGMAPDAKITFYDIGMTKEAFLVVPPMNKILFPTAYKAGARVHTNSWGDLGGLYSQTAVDVDTFAHEHPDMLIIFAAGNSGDEGFESCGAPGVAKNSLDVGCEQIHNAETEIVHPDLTVSYFSSIGPTYDGRFKPDIVAPGDYIMSAYSSYPEALDNAINGGWYGSGYGIGEVKETCSAIQMSGTSMAAPAVAGIALLIRQYFMDPEFWASICSPFYKTCKEGAFEPSGYFLKAIILHSGQAMGRYSIPEYDSYTKIPSRPLGPPPDVFQGYGALRLSNILPLKAAGGLDRDLDLVVWDRLDLREYHTLKWEIVMKPEDVKPIKITVAWYDPPSPMYSSSNLLLHDIDLVVISPTGKKLWGNSYENGDDKNPNEQIFIQDPVSECQQFKRKQCSYLVYVHAHMLAEANSQHIAVIMTTSAKVLGPSESQDNWFLPPETPHTPAPTQDLQSYYVDLQGSLRGRSIMTREVQIPICSILEWVDVELGFDPMGTSGTLPNDCQLIIEDPTKRSVAIGGSDLSYPSASFTVVWPNEFHNMGVTRGGTWKTSVGLHDTDLKSPGTWKFMVMNGWSKAGNVSYHLKATAKFKAGGDTCVPSPNPTKRPSLEPTISAVPSAAPTRSKYSTVTVPVSRRTLGVAVADGKLEVPREFLSKFYYTGTLKAVAVNMDGNKSISNYGWYLHSLAIIVTSPSGRMVQIGGFHDWFGVEDRFYRRNLPDIWYYHRSDGKPFMAYRDVSPGEISSLNSNEGHWTVELALGYDAKPVRNLDYSGVVVLYFDPVLVGKKKGEILDTNYTKPTKFPSMFTKPPKTEHPTLSPDTPPSVAANITANKKQKKSKKPTAEPTEVPSPTAVASGFSIGETILCGFVFLMLIILGASCRCGGCKRRSPESAGYVEMPRTDIARKLDVESIAIQSNKQDIQLPLYGSTE